MFYVFKSILFGRTRVAPKPWCQKLEIEIKQHGRLLPVPYGVFMSELWTFIYIHSHEIFLRQPVVTFQTKCHNIVCVTGETISNTQALEFTLRWRYNERDGVSNHQPHDCLLNRLFRRRSKKTSKVHVTGLCAGNSPVTGEFPAQRASNAENVSIWWHHHAHKLLNLIWLNQAIQ